MKWSTVVIQIDDLTDVDDYQNDSVVTDIDESEREIWVVVEKKAKVV